MTGNPFAIACPYCSAPAGQPCRRAGGTPGRQPAKPHAERERDAPGIVTGSVDAPITAAEARMGLRAALQLINADTAPKTAERLERLEQSIALGRAIG